MSARTIALAVMVLLCLIMGAQESIAGEKQRIDKLSTHSPTILPTIAGDGSIMFITRKFHPDNVGGMEDLDDIWYAERLPGGGWSEARNIGAPLNTVQSDALFSVSPDAGLVLISGHYLDLSTKHAGFSISRRKNGVWTQPKKVYINSYRNLSRYAFGFLAGDGRTLMLAMESENTVGSLDLYVAHHSTEHDLVWEKPVHLGPVINSDQFESSSYLAGDRTTLYYASERPGGLGLADIYISRRLDDTWQNWSEPLNLGEAFNSLNEDSSISLSIDGDTLYYHSANAEGKEVGIYFAVLPDEFKPEPYALLSGTLSTPHSGQESDDVFVKAYVLSDTIAPVPVAQSLSRIPQGTFAMTLPKGREYIVEARAPGFPPAYTFVDCRDLDKFTRITRKVILERQAENTEPFVSVHFASNDTIVKPEHRYELLKAVLPVLHSKDARLEIVGHADDVGQNPDNLYLSLRRARAIARELEERGVPADAMKVHAKGESEPRIKTGTHEARELNRRVEIYVRHEAQ